MAEVKKFCVIGLPAKHSLSPKIHKSFASQQGINIQYKIIEPDTEEHFETHAQSFFSKNGYGANVTIPFKEQAYNFADEIDTSARECGSANTLFFYDKKITAYNTDGKGFLKDLQNKNIDLSRKDILILGAGGSARSIVNSLRTLDVKKIDILTRTISRADDLKKMFDKDVDINVYKNGIDYNFIINTTPISLTSEQIEFPLGVISSESLTYDLFYSNKNTRFQEWSLRNGANTSYNGIGMLVEQAAFSYEIWNGFTPNTKEITDELSL